MGYGNPRRGGTGGGSGPTTATVSDLQLQHYRASVFDLSAETQFQSIQEDTASISGNTFFDLQVFDVAFPVGWPANKTITISGYDRKGAAQSETFAPPGAGAGGRVHGTKVFSTPLASISCANPSAGSGLVASIQHRNVVCVPTVPVASFDKIVIASEVRSVVASSLSQGWVQASGTEIQQYDNVLVLYTHEPEVILT